MQLGGNEAILTNDTFRLFIIKGYTNTIVEGFYCRDLTVIYVQWLNLHTGSSSNEEFLLLERGEWFPFVKKYISRFISIGYTLTFCKDIYKAGLMKNEDEEEDEEEEEEEEEE